MEVEMRLPTSLIGVVADDPATMVLCPKALGGRDANEPSLCRSNALNFQPSSSGSNFWPFLAFFTASWVTMYW